jgi:hypothetical protein
MNIIVAFFIEIALTLLIVIVVLGYLRPFLRRILLDLCGTDDRAQFWTTFTNIVLLSLPMISALGFSPTASLSNSILIVAHQLKSNLLSFIFGLALIGFVLAFFTLLTSRTTERNKAN